MKPTIADVLKAAIDAEGTKYQFIHEAVVGAKAVKRKKDQPAHTRLELVTQVYSVNDTAFPSKAQFVGVIVWVPKDVYRNATEAQKGESES